MLGEGISIADLYELLTAIRGKNDLVLEVKVLDQSWQPLGRAVLRAMVDAVKEGKIHGGSDIRLRLHGKESSSG